MWQYDSMRDEPPNEMLMDENDTVEFWRLCSVGDLTSAEFLSLRPSSVHVYKVYICVTSVTFLKYVHL